MTPTPDELRRIDQRVAIEVMGWHLADRKECGWGDGPDVWLTGDSENPTQQHFHPTEQPAAAFEVLRRCSLRLSDTVHQITITHTEGDGFVVTTDSVFPKHDPFHIANAGVAPTLELAICLFALRLFGKPSL